MTCILPEPRQALQAVRIFLQHAYDPPLPSSVQTAMDSLQLLKDDFYTAPPFARSNDPQRPQYWLRLGNRRYPHMKLMIEPCPDGNGWLFRADTHDLHICPKPDHPEYPAFMELREHNRRLAERIESDWVAKGLPTFQTYLKDALSQLTAQKLS
jgi:hypothetical protein